MREIKFRGKNEDGWYYGLLTYMFSSYAISHVEDENIVDLIDQETVGQYTGLKDKKDVEIYEGDIFRGKSGFMIVKFENGAFVTEYKFNIRGYEEVNIMPLSVTSRGAKVIGNIHDNPELLEVTK